MDPILSVSYSTIASFFEAAEGNYRNAVYVSCNCNYTKESGCGDFLFIPGPECKPILLPLDDAENFMGNKVDKSDCAAIISSCTFLHLYNKWIDMTVSSSRQCPIQQLLHLMNRPQITK